MLVQQLGWQSFCFGVLLLAGGLGNLLLCIGCCSTFSEILSQKPLAQNLPGVSKVHKNHKEKGENLTDHGKLRLKKGNSLTICQPENEILTTSLAASA